jgi:hypothetical protein
MFSLLGRHFDIVGKKLRHELGIVAEGVGSLSEKIDRQEARIAKVTEDLDTRVARLGGSVLATLTTS